MIKEKEDEKSQTIEENIMKHKKEMAEKNQMH